MPAAAASDAEPRHAATSSTGSWWRYPTPWQAPRRGWMMGHDGGKERGRAARAEALGIAVAVFAVYVEGHPGLGNIWFRVRSCGDRRPSLSGLCEYLLRPLSEPMLWQPRLLDANSFVVVPSLSCAYVA
eukprot:gene7412-11655_t